MESTVSKSKRSKSILSFLLMFFVSLCTLVTFTACKLTNSDPDQGANFDASGNLKLVSPYVEFNKYSGDEKVIDENSGSFTWKLQYYYSGSNEDYLKNINFDQDYLFANFFSDADFENIYTGNIPAKGATPGDNYFVNGPDKLYSPVFYINKDNISFPSYEVVVDGNYYTFKVCVNKNYLERMSNQEISNKIIYDGTTTRLKNIFTDKTYDYDNKKWKDNNGDGEADDYGSLFTFEYRAGKNTDGAFVECPKGMMSYYINNYGEFCIRFNPQLQAGSVNRYLKVKALADCEGRANSNYSSTVAFEAYAVSFEVYSPNSATLDYGGLDYDHDQYYFAYEKTYYDSHTDKNAIKALTGYFPEGRKIVVSRTSDYNDSYNYAFQNWTMNTKAEYSLADKEKYPASINTKTIHTGSEILSDKTKSLSDAFQVVESYRNVQDLSYYEKAEIGVTQIQKKEGNEKLLLYTYSPVHTRTGADAETKIHDEIVVTSHSTINGYKFYANYAKVRGFLASGSFFAGDNFFTTGDQNLSEVSIFLFYKIYDEHGSSKYTSTQLSVSDGQTTGTKTHEDLFSSSNGDNDVCYPNNRKNPNNPGNPEDKVALTYTIDGSYFKVEGLENTDFIIFQKEGKSLLTELNKPYSFYSQYLKEIEAMDSTFKGLDLVVSDNLISDRQDVGIIGTQYAENSNVVVNLYRLLDSKGTTEGLSSTYLDLLKNTDVSYEIIKSVSSVEDENGFITTNIILSLILPSNATLTGYNVETVQTNSKIFFSTSNAENAEIKYVSFVKYDETTMDEYVVDINGEKSTDEKTLPVYEFVKTLITDSKTVNIYSSQMVYYKETLYTLDHEEVGGYLASSDTSRIYLYKADAGKYLVKEGEKWFELSYNKMALTPEYSLENGETTYKINGITVYEQRNSSNVSTIAKAYETEMIFKNPNNTSESQQVYVYYDVKQVGEKFFYISPIGKQTLITSKNSTTSSTTTNVQDDLYFSQISNFNDLKTKKKIMLGSEILSSNIDFKEAIGSKLIMNCYYYVEVLGSQTELFFSQYINNDETKENLTVITYYDKNGNQYKGETCQGHTYNNTTKEIENTFKTSLILRNPQGVIVDSDTYKYYAGFETTSGTALKNAHNYLKENNYNITGLETKFEFILNGATYKSTTITDGYGKNLKYKNVSNNKDTGTYALAQETTIGIYGSTNSIKRLITMYEYNESAGRFISYSLFFDGSSYHKIIGSTYVSCDGGSKSEQFFVYDTNELKFNFNQKETIDKIEKSTTNLDIDSPGNENRKIDYFSLITDTNSGITAKQRVYGESKEKTITSYTRFIVNSFVEYEYDGETRTRKIVNTYSPVVKDEDGNKQLINQTTANTVTLENFLGINKDASGNITSFTELYFKKETKEFVNYKDTLVRRAQTKENKDVTVLGKYITTNDASDPKVYPSFSSFLTFTEEETYVLDRNSDGEINYYSMDYTTKKSVVEGFPGFSLLAGIPYPNPVLTFQVRHKSYENPTINIALDISNGYYVEVMGTNIATDETNLVRDFTTYSFKDTVENLLQNDYIDNAYWVLERSTFNTVFALVETNDKNNYDFKSTDEDEKYYNYYMYTTEVDENNNVVKKSSPLTIQNVGLNENDKHLYAEGYVGVDNTYYKKLYVRCGGNADSQTIEVKELTTDDVILWKTNASVLSSVPTFDIHTYSQGLDGIIYFNSGSYNDENIICNGLSGITSGSTQSANGYYDYSEVLIGGVTFAYRTLSSQMNNSDNMSGYQFDKMINVLNAYNSTDAYFLTGKESAVLVASPIVKIADGAGNSFVYRFREWKVYSRYNSEVLYYNRGVTENLADRYNAILRFSSGSAGYFVMFPVYERVFDIDLGSAIVDGAINQGGSINVSYKDGDESDVDNLYDDNLYFINYEKISYGDKEGYYYGNLKGYPFLYFTGKFVKKDNGENDTSKPIFETLDNVYVVELTTTLSSTYVTEKNVDVPLFFQIDESTKHVKFLNIISKFEENVPGIVLLENYNGQYTYYGFDNIIYKFEDDDGFYLENESDPVKFYEILNTSFTADFFFDEITESSISTSVPLHYDTTTQTFEVLDVKGNSFFGSEFILSLMFYNVYRNEILFSSIDAILAFCDEINNKKNAGYNENSPWILAINNINNEDEIKTKGGMIISGLDDMGKISTYLGDKIASYDKKIFTVIKKITNPYVNGLYVSRFGSLNAGELATDEDGNIYSSQQFKTAYLDRDSYVELQAIADNGYRFEGWYKCEYDEENGFWFTTDEKVQNSKNIYSDEIIPAYYNKYTGRYYYITDYCEDFDYTDDNGGSIVAHIYYLDSDHTELAVVPDRMLDKVRGYFINHGTKNNPNYIQVFKRYGGLLDESYYYDSSFINPVDTTAYEVEERTFIDSIRILNYGSDGTFYYLSNVGIYFNEENGKYYRDMTTGNIVVSGDKITIKNLHSNVRFVAKFIETYNEYIFAEDEESTGISIEAIYYSNNNQKYDSDGNIVIRTDIDGNNRTNTAEYSDSVAKSLEQVMFKLYEDETNEALLSASGSDKNYMSSTYDYSSGTYTETNDYSVYETLLTKGFSNVTGSLFDTYSVNKDDPTLNKKLNLQSMYFDVNTTVTIVVRVKAEFELSVHSLGVNSKYNIYPIFYPTSDYIEANQKASSDTKVDYLYYILQLTYNRDPQNQYRGYIVHPNRGENMAYDALVGNYIDVYGSFFDYYDNNGKLIDYEISKSMEKTTDKTEIKLDSNYVSEVSGSKVSLNSSYSNFEEALKELSKLMGNPELLKVDHIKLKVDVKDKNGNVAYQNGLEITNKNTLIAVLKEIFNSVRPTDKNQTNTKNELDTSTNNEINLIQNGQRNFINLSTIPVYNYTVQAIVIDSDKENGEIKKDQDGKVILPSANYEVEDITYPTLKNSLYVTGGTGGKNYLGSGSKGGTEYYYKTLFTDESKNQNYTTSTTLKFDNYVSGIDYAEKNTSTNPTGNESLFEDLVFVQNSIILFEGIQKVPEKEGVTYLFVGWYEQKYNRDTETWSDLVFMSSEETTPYVSLATADTVIVAIYKRAVNVTFTFDQSEIAVEMSNALVDSAGDALEITKSNNVVTMNGTFFFDADIEAILSLAGGYRFDGISYSDDGSNVSVFDKLTFSNYNHYYSSEADKFKKCDSSEAILNSILKINFKLNEILPDNTSTVTLNIKTKKLTLVYFSVDNFIVNDKTTGNKDKFMGYDFALVQKNSTDEKILFATKNGKLVGEVGKDSANNDIFTDIDYTLSVYGYFDSDIADNDNLVLLTFKKNDLTEETSINQWFINRDTSSTYYTSNEKYFKDVNLSYDGTFSTNILNIYAGYTIVDNFKIVFKYSDNVKDVDGNKLNDSSFLNLSKDNAVYFAQAKITTDTTSVLKVSHYLVENISNASTKNSSIEQNSNLGRKLGDGDGKITILTYSGSTASGEGESLVGNSADLIKMDYSEEFSSGTKIDLDVSSKFFIDKGKLYVFVGWFSENATSGKLTLLSTSNSISNQKANGSYVARFVRVSKIDSSSINNADITFEGTQMISMGSVSANVQVFGELDNVSWNGSTFIVDENAKRLQYAFVGSSLRFTLIPRPNMVIHSCSVSGNSSGNISFTEAMNSSNSSAIDYTVEKLPTNNVVSISATIKKGYTVKIQQTLYDNINMTGDSESLSGCVSVRIGSENSYDATDSEFSVEPGKTITLTGASNDYYFIGFFIENKIVSKKDGKYENSHTFTITENTIIEARFTKYNYVAVTSTLQGTNTTIENFTFTLSYVDPRTGSEIKFENVNELLKIPAGILATIRTTSDSDAYNFIGFKTIDFDGKIKKSISSNKTAQLALDQTYCSASNEMGILKGDKGEKTDFIYISAMYQKTTVLKVVKNVEISSVSQTYFSEGTNKNLTEEQMRSLFNLIVSYVDSYGESRTVTLGSVNQLSNIKVKKGSTVKITPVISSVVSHRYTVYDFEFKYDNNSHKSDVTQKSDGSFEFVCGDDSKMSSLEFTVYFKPCKTVTISKELAGSSTSDVTVDYSFVNSNNANQTGTLSLTNKTEINIKEGGNFTLTANVSDADKFTFIGWFVDGKMISNQKTISSIPSSSNYMSELKTASSIVAKFMETINFKVQRSLFEFENKDPLGTDVTDEKYDSNFGEFFVVADFVNDDGMSHSVKKMSLSEIRKSTNLKIIAGTKISVVSTQSPKYLFDGYQFHHGESYDTFTGDSLTDGYSLVTENGFSQDLTILVKFKEFRPVTYLVSTTNSDSKSENGIEISNPETHLSRVVDNDNSFGISFDAVVHEEGYVIESIEFNGNKVDYSVQNNTYSLTVKNEYIVKENNILKINVKETLKINVYVAFDDITDASKVNNVPSVTINGSSTTLTSSSGTLLASKTDIKTFEKVTITVPGTVDGFRFDGFYLYEGDSAVSSVAPITFENTFEFLANSSLSVVAKFTSNKTPSSINTRILNDEGNSNFAGWFARVNSTTSSTGYRDILLSTEYSDKDSFNGKFDIVVAKYQTTSTTDQTVEISGDFAHFGSAIIFVHSSSLSNVSVEGTSTNLKVSNVETGSMSVDFIPAKGFIVTNKTDFACEIEKKQINVEVQVDMNEVTKNVVSNSGTTSSVSVKDNKITAEVTIKINGAKNSTVLANILNSETNETTSKTLTTTDNEFKVQVQSGSSINLSFALATFEKFNGFKITENGSSRVVTTISLDYLVSNSFENVTIEVLFDDAFISTIAENDTTKGTASLHEEKTGETVLFVQVYDGYEISAIFATEISSGSIVEWENIFESEDDAKDLLGNDLTITSSVSEKDSFETDFVTKCEIKFTASKNVAFKIEYKMVSKVNFYVYAGGKVEVISKYVNDSPLTLEKIESFDILSKLEDEKIKDAYSLDKFSYLGEEITSETKIDLSDGIINIEVSMNKAYKLKFSIVKDSSGIDFQIPTDGLKVTFEGKTIATFVGIFQPINYKLSNLTKVVAFDENEFYDFSGFFSKGKLISSASSYVFTASDILENLEQIKIGEETVYVVNVMFKERYQTLTIKKDYNFEGKNLTLKLNGTEISSNEAYQYIMIEGCGNIAHRMLSDSEGNSYFEVSYPYSVVLNEKASQLTITQNAEENNSDPYLKIVKASAFYELDIDGQYYRFDNFYGENNLPFENATKYSNKLTINLKDLGIDKTVIAKMIKLYQIDYIYDVVDPNVKISIDFLKIDTDGTGVVYETVASSANKENIKDAIISYRAEAGITIRVNVDFQGANTETKEAFKSVLVTASNALSQLSNASISSFDWTKHINDNNYIAVSKFLSGTNAFSSLVVNDTSSFNFKPTQNLSFIADFGHGSEDVGRSTFSIVSVFWTLNKNLTLYKVGDSMVSTIDGQGFSFTSTNTGASSMGYAESSLTISDSKNVILTLLELKKINTYKDNYYKYSSTKKEGNQYNYHVILNLYSKIETGVRKIIKSDYGVEISTFDKDAPHVNTSAKTIDKGGTEVTISVTPIDQFFFKGFAIVSSNYESTYNILQLGGERANATTEQYNFVKHQTSYDETTGIATKYSATVKISGNSKIVAIFEPTVYTITVNTYKFFEDNKNVNYSDDREKLVEKSSDINASGDIDEDKYQKTESATIEGSLIALAGESIKITSVSYQYSQFVGFTGTPGIDFGFDSGEGISSKSDEIKQVFNKTEEIEFTSDLQIYLDEEPENEKYVYFKGTLQKYNIKPGYNKDEFGGLTYVTSSSRNNFYALNVNQSFTINFFYTNLSYKLMLDLSETESTIYYDNSSNKNSIKSTSYLAYSEDYTSWKDYYDSGKTDPSQYEQETFINLSAGTYSITKNYGTNSKNNDDNKYTIKIEENDPFVYVINDSNDKYIGYPTKISVELVEMQNSSGDPNMMDILYKETGVRVQIAQADKKDFGYKSGNELYLKGYAEDGVGAEVGNLKKYGFDYNVSGKSSDGRPTLRNITNYLTANGTLKDDLFVIEIDNETINSQNIQDSNLSVNYEEQTIRVVYKIVASDVGFPTVSVTMFDSTSGKKSTENKLLASINKVQIKNNTKSENKQTKSESSASNIFSITGFNQALFETDAQTSDPNFKLGNIDVNLNLIWKTTAKEVVAKVELVGLGAITLTGVKSDSNYKKIAYDSRGCCLDATNHSGQHVREHDEEIKAYFIIIVKNGFTLIDLLQKLLNEGYLDQGTAGTAMTYLLETPYGITNGYGKLTSNETAQIGHGAVGSLTGGGDQRSDIFKQVNTAINKYYKTSNVDYFASTFAYHVIDAYELYKNEINGNFFNNASNTNDLVVAQCVLQEHEQKQIDHRGGWLGWIWTADKGYAYYNSATGSFDAVKNNGSYSVTYHNNAEKAEMDTTSTTKVEERSFWDKVVGTFNSSKSFAGTYNRFITIGYAPTDADFIANDNIIAKITIDNDQGHRVITREFDYDPMPILNAVTGMVTYLAPAFLALIPGVGVGLSIAYCVVAVGSAIWSICDPDVKFIYDYWANIY